MDAHNPYAAPAEPPGAHPAASRQAPLPLAPRLARFGGAVIDALFSWGIHLAALTAVGFLVRKTALLSAGWVSRHRTIDLLAFAGASVIIFCIQGILIARRGQSLGKLVTRTRIVRTDGTPTDILRGLLVRSLPVSLFSVAILLAELSPYYRSALHPPVPPILTLLCTLDVLLIFGPTRRCGHDFLADTLVVKLPARQ